MTEEQEKKTESATAGDKKTESVAKFTLFARGGGYADLAMQVVAAGGTALVLKNVDKRYLLAFLIGSGLNAALMFANLAMTTSIEAITPKNKFGDVFRNIWFGVMLGGTVLIGDHGFETVLAQPTFAGMPRRPVIATMGIPMFVAGIGLAKASYNSYYAKPKCAK